MFNVLIFGTGVSMQKMINYINYEKVNIVAFVDNDVNKVGKKIREKNIISPVDIKNYEYDFIIIASLAYREISEQLLNLNVNKEKIVQLYNGSFTLGETILFNDEVVNNWGICQLFTSIECARLDFSYGGLVNKREFIRDEVEKYYNSIDLSNIRDGFKLLIWFIDTTAGRSFANQVVEGCRKGGIDYLSIFDLENKRVWNNEVDFLEVINEYKPSAIFVNLLDANSMPFQVPNNLPVLTWMDHFSEQIFIGNKYFKNLHKYNILCCPYLSYDDKVDEEIRELKRYKNNIVNFPFTANKKTFINHKLDMRDIEKYSTDISIISNYRGIEYLYDYWGLKDNFINTQAGIKLKNFINLLYNKIYDKINLEGNFVEDFVFYGNLIKDIWDKEGLNIYLDLNNENIEKYVKLSMHSIGVIAYLNIIPEWLKEKGYNFKLYGRNWDKIERFKDYSMGNIQNEVELSKAYQCSKIIVDANVGLSIHRRMFEAILSGSFILLGKSEMEKINFSKADIFFEESKSIVSYASKQELYEKLDYYLSYEEERKTITKEGQKVIEDNKLYADEVLKNVIEKAVEKIESIAKQEKY